MSYKIYVAGKFEEKKRVQEVMNLLRAVGHTITHDWSVVSEASKRSQAVLDMRGVIDCDVFVGVFEKDLPYRGAHSELGAALVLGKPVYLLGKWANKNIFTYHPNVRKGQDAFDRDLVLGLI
jgi:hypothetical protein